MTELFLLFISSFLAATILPTASEAVLAGLVKMGNNDTILLLLIATTGNVLGAVVNWFIGIKLLYFKDKKFFPLSKEQLATTTKLYQKFGIWSLFFAWVPIIGDPLTVIAGIFKVRLLTFVTFVTIGKLARYYCIILLIT